MTNFDETVIQGAVEAATSARRQMREQQIIVKDTETEAKLDNMAEYMAAKNSEQRQMVLESALRDDEGYHTARFDYDQAKEELKVAMLHIKACDLHISYLAATGRPNPQTATRGGNG